jgi:hypothetical protein
VQPPRAAFLLGSGGEGVVFHDLESAVSRLPAVPSRCCSSSPRYEPRRVTIAYPAPYPPTALRRLCAARCRTTRCASALRASIADSWPPMGAGSQSQSSDVRPSTANLTRRRTLGTLRRSHVAARVFVTFQVAFPSLVPGNGCLGAN